MEYVKQSLIILFVSFVGELFNFFLPFPVPGNIYGMVLMFVLLMSGCIQVRQIENVACFLLDIMPILFIPSAVGIMTKIKELSSIWWQIFLIIVITTIIVIAVSGLVTQSIISRDNKKVDHRINDV